MEYIRDMTHYIYYTPAVQQSKGGGGLRDIEVVNHVRVARVENNLTQEQLAQQVGVTRQTIGLIEAGMYNPTLRLCLMIARATGKTLNDLFWIKGER